MKEEGKDYSVNVSGTNDGKINLILISYIEINPRWIKNVSSISLIIKEANLNIREMLSFAAPIGRESVLMRAWG